MVAWVSLNPTWKLQNVQAGLSQVISILCAGAAFVLVRYFWLAAARRVVKHADVVAHNLLSLNTIGEIFDVILLLRHELFTRRYLTLLLQCIAVVLLTIATMMSAFLARFSTRNGIVVRPISVNGSIAQRSIGNIGHAEIDRNLTMGALKEAKWPLTQLVEFLPTANHDWDFVGAQMNSSWSMKCSYNQSIPIEDPVATGNCTNLQSEIPQLPDPFWDWNKDSNTSSWGFDGTNWVSERRYRDWISIGHGLNKITWNSGLNMWTEVEMRTIITYLSGVPKNYDNTTCDFGEGSIDRAYYTSASCRLKRDTAGRTKDELFYGARPDNYEVGTMATAYVDHWGNAFFKASVLHHTVPSIEAEDLVYLYISHLAVKDTVVSPYVTRTINVRLQVPQVSSIALILCSVTGGFVLFGLVSYWSFLFTHWSQLKDMPQSKIDWVLRTMNGKGSLNPKQRLNAAMASGNEDSHSTLLNKTNKDDDRSWRSVSRSSSSVISLPPYRDYDSERQILDTRFSGKTPDSAWFPTYKPYNPYTAQSS